MMHQIMNRRAPYGHRIHDLIDRLPKFELNSEVWYNVTRAFVSIQRTVNAREADFKINVRIKNDNVTTTQTGGKYALYADVIVGKQDDVLEYRRFT